MRNEMSDAEAEREWGRLQALQGKSGAATPTAAPKTPTVHPAVQVKLDADDDAMRQQAIEIVQACAAAGCLTEAGEFIGRGLTGEQVRQELIARSWRRVNAEQNRQGGA